MTNPAQPPRPTAAPFPPLHIPEGQAIEYANLVRIAHSTTELVFDFAHLLPGDGPAQISSRIVMSPLSAKLFHRALSENLARYEAAFGEIRIPGDSGLADRLFRPINPPDHPPSE